jgi:hypothetical protein
LFSLLLTQKRRGNDILQLRIIPVNCQEVLPPDGEKRSTRCRKTSPGIVRTSPGLGKTSPGLVEIPPGLVVTRGDTVFTKVVTVYVKNATFFNAPKASWLRQTDTRAGAPDFLRFSRPSRTVFRGGSLHDKHEEQGVHSRQKLRQQRQ